MREKLEEARGRKRSADASERPSSPPDEQPSSSAETASSTGSKKQRFSLESQTHPDMHAQHIRAGSDGQETSAANDDSTYEMDEDDAVQYDQASEAIDDDEEEGETREQAATLQASPYRIKGDEVKRKMLKAMGAKRSDSNHTKKGKLAACLMMGHDMRNFNGRAKGQSFREHAAYRAFAGKSVDGQSVSGPKGRGELPGRAKIMMANLGERAGYLLPREPKFDRIMKEHEEFVKNPPFLPNKFKKSVTDIALPFMSYGRLRFEKDAIDLLKMVTAVHAIEVFETASVVAAARKNYTLYQDDMQLASWMTNRPSVKPPVR